MLIIQNNNNSQKLMRNYYELVAILRALKASSHLTLKITLRSRNCNYLFCRDDETDAWRGYEHLENHRVDQKWLKLHY